MIERFSEDIDLILDWGVVSKTDPMEERSRKKQKAFIEGLRENSQAYIKDHLLDLVKAMINDVCNAEIDSGDPGVINIEYPASFSNEYLRPEIRLEVGPLGAREPSEIKNVSCYAAQEFPDVFEKTHFNVHVVKAERTFWEKVIILHQEAHRPEHKTQPLRYSRHYYDLAKMADSKIKEIAFKELKLLESVVEFVQHFYQRSWANYDLATPGTLKLVPEGHVLETVKSDYAEMKNMIFGEVPSLDSIIATLKVLEDEINNIQ